MFCTFTVCCHIRSFFHSRYASYLHFSVALIGAIIEIGLIICGIDSYFIILGDDFKVIDSFDPTSGISSRSLLL